jgi:hypothetical protein
VSGEHLDQLSPIYKLYSFANNSLINTSKRNKMTIQKQMTYIKIHPNALPTNITNTPVNVIFPKQLPQRDDTIWLVNPIKITSQ